MLVAGISELIGPVFEIEHNPVILIGHCVK